MKLSYYPVAGILVALAGSVIIAQTPAPKSPEPASYIAARRDQRRRHQRQCQPDRAEGGHRRNRPIHD